MSGNTEADTSRKAKIPPWLLHCFLAALALAALSGLCIWLVQRSLRTPAKKRAMQSWLDEKLNADVSLSGDMVVRVNLLRDSRLMLHDTEIEHPNPVFPGKFARITKIGAWAPPWSVAGLLPGRMRLLFEGAQIALEESTFGDWSINGLMQPLAIGDSPFPFPMPKISSWQAIIEKSSLAVKRRGHEMLLDLEGVVSGGYNRNRIDIHADRTPFSFGRVDTPEARLTGQAEPVNLRVVLPAAPGELPEFVAGGCELRVKGLPVATLPFFVNGIPIEDGPGVFNGLIRYDQHPDSAGALYLEGQLTGVPLGVFGLPPSAPIRATWPIRPARDNLPAAIHMGPSGFGAFEITIPLAEKGMPKGIVMRGDVAALDEVPVFFSKHRDWPRWLSRMFPKIEWRSGAWRGFGWEGKDLSLALSRSTAGLNLNGFGEMLGGKVRLAATPEQEGSLVTVGGEKLDAGLLAAKMSGFLPDASRMVRPGGGGVSLTWRSYPSGEGDFREWGLGVVCPKPVVDLLRSGAWWGGMPKVAGAILAALPDWGGGRKSELERLSGAGLLELDQASVVAERGAEGWLTVEFRGYGDVFGQASGILEMRRDGAVEGEFLLTGESDLLEAVLRANGEFGEVLDFLANEGPGLRVGFSYEPGGRVEFSFPFLAEAERVRGVLREEGNAGKGTPPEAE